MYTLSLLDQSPSLPGDKPADSLQRTIKMAQFAEELGFKRFWVSEHHNSKELLGSAPEVLIAQLLAKTSSIRVGSGGIMLSHYSPFKVAEVFNILANLAPGRVDLGVGKAPGGLPAATKALQYNGLSDPQDFNDRLEGLQQFVSGTAELIAEPTPEIRPELILLGGSISSAKKAAELGISYVFAQFINSDEQQLIEAAKLYKEINPAGTFGVAMAIIAADTKAEAAELVKNTDIFKVIFEDGSKFTLTNFENANRFGIESGKNYHVDRVQSPAIFGETTEIFDKLDSLNQLGVDEFIIHNPILEEKARFHSIQLLSTYHNIKI